MRHESDVLLWFVELNLVTGVLGRSWIGTFATHP